MFRYKLHAAALVLCACGAMAGCGGTSLSAPSPSAPTTSEIPTAGSQAELSLGCTEQVDGYQCQAHFVSGPGASPQDVTGLASWSTGDPGIATVDSTGWVTVYRDGNVAVRATYRGVDGFVSMQVQAGGLRRYYYALSGWVTSTRDASHIVAATVEIVSGPNAGRSTTTDVSGAYQLYDLTVGTFTLRITKAGYVTTERTYTLTGEHFNSLDVSLAPTP